MANKFSERIRKAWNAFASRDSNDDFFVNSASYISSYNRPDRVRFSRGNERSVVTSIYTRIAIDAASIQMLHVKLDENGRYVSTMDTALNDRLTIEANKDQTGRAFRQDIVESMIDEGCVAIVPIDTLKKPGDLNGVASTEILSLRVGKITQWYSDSVKVNIYNDRTGQHEDLICKKSDIAIVENPFYSIMNEPSSVMQRLVRKLVLLDAIDEQSGSGKLDIIIQLPYSLRSDSLKTKAEDRRKALEDQLSNSKYGVGYIDSTERITQLNRPAENNLMKQIEYLTSMLYSQSGITQAVLDGTASEEEMSNYYSRTIEPFLSAITDEMNRKFLTKTARSQHQAIMFFRDPFRLVPVSKIAEIADKFTRNEILSSNEVRQLIGMKPSDDPHADELRNKNLNESGHTDAPAVTNDLANTNKEEIQNG